MSPRRIVIAVSGWIAMAATLLPAASPERIVPTVAFLVLAPGAAFVGLRHRIDRASAPDALEDFTLTFVVSLGLGALVSEALYLSHTFTLSRALVALAALTTAGALIPGRRRAGEEVS
jgi:hypothetical protein